MSTTGDMVIDLNFVPEWARAPADQSRYARFEDRSRGRGMDRGLDRDRRRPANKSGFADRRRMGAEAKDNRRADPGTPRSFPPERGGFRAAGAASSASPSSAGGSRRQDGGNRPPPIEASFIPEHRGIKPLAARLARSGRAYPLFEVATLFLSKPDFYAVKLDVIPGVPGAEAVFLFQCVECKAVFFDRAGAAAHVLNKHMALFYAREETQVEPPKGTFVCVARCSLSGELLGPPNYHEFNERLMELHGSRFASMSLDAYRRHIVNVTDPAAIEQWKQDACRQISYQTLRAAEPLTFKRRSRVEAHFMENYAPALIRQGRRFIMPGVASRDLEDPLIRRIVEEAWTQENQFPLKMAVAIQPAFRRLGLHMFKASGKATFVTAIPPHAIDPSQSTDGIRRMLECLCAHPGISRHELVNLLHPVSAPGAAVDAPEAAAILHDLRWMVDKGHVIEFYNGKLAVPSRKPEGVKTNPRA